MRKFNNFIYNRSNKINKKLTYNYHFNNNNYILKKKINNNYLIVKLVNIKYR